MFCIEAHVMYSLRPQGFALQFELVLLGQNEWTATSAPSDKLVMAKF